MEKFNFNGSWEFDLELNQFSDFFSFHWVGEANYRREKVKVQIIEFQNVMKYMEMIK